MSSIRQAATHVFSTTTALHNHQQLRAYGCAVRRQRLSIMNAAVSKACEAGARKLLACSVYLSEGQAPSLLQRFKRIAEAAPGVVLVNVFVDEPYHRSSYTFASPSVQQVMQPY